MSNSDDIITGATRQWREVIETGIARRAWYERVEQEIEAIAEAISAGGAS